MNQSRAIKRRNSDQNKAGSSTSKREEFLDSWKSPGSGIKLTEHGNIYQLKILMLCLLRAEDERKDKEKEKQEKYKFRLATELPEAEKFDDVVFQYQNKSDEKWKFRLLQAKHKEGSTELQKIKESDLLNREDEDFSLQKYFHSYLKIKRRTVENSIYNVFSDSEIEDVILITNIDLANELKYQFTKENINEDRLFKLDQNNEVVNVLKFNQSELVKKFKPIFNETSDFHKLVNEITERLKNGKAMLDTRNPIFKEYYYPLSREVFDIEGKKFRTDFINNRNLSKEAKVHREKLGNIQYEKKIKFPKKKYEPEENPIIPNVSEFVKQIQKLLKENKKEKIVEINKDSVEKEKFPIFSANIKRLAGYVLIERFNVIRFSNSFVHSTTKLPGNLEEFKGKLKATRKENFESIYEYEFIIPKFETCEEGAYDRKLPVLHSDEDVKDFFKKFKFIVNYPNRFSINDLLEKEIQNKLKKLDGEAYNSLYHHKLHNWMAKRIGTFYTGVNSLTLFEDIKSKLLPWTMDGVTLSYFANIHDEYEFEEYKPLNDFLNNEQKVLHLVSQDVRLGRMRTVQTFEKLKEKDIREIGKYTRGFGHIFVRLQQLSVADFREDVLIFFQNKEKCNLLVIECSCEKDSQDLNEKLVEILKEENKKIILISDINFVLAQNFLNHPGYEKPDISASFKDLTAKSQEKLLEQEITFQGLHKMRLNEIIDVTNENANKIIDHETLFKLIENENKELKIEIGKNPISISDLEAAYIKIYEKIDEIVLGEVFKEMYSIAKDIQNLEQQRIYFVVGGIQKPDLLSRFKQQVSHIEQTIVEFKPDDTYIEKNITIADFQLDEKDFRKICHNNATKNIYWIDWEHEQNRFLVRQFYDSQFYLKREFQYPKRTLDKNDVKTKLSKADLLDIFIFSGIKDEKDFKDSFEFDLEAKEQFEFNHKNNKIKLLTKTLMEDSEFKQKNPNASIHLVQVNKSYQLMQYTKIDSDDNLMEEIKGKSIIIIDEPGMGKSTSLVRLSQEMQNSYWVMHLELKDCFKAIQNLPENTNDINIDHLVKFLADTKTIDTPLERNLVQLILKDGSNSKPLLLLFDGFDEIKCGNIGDLKREKERVSALLKFIKSNTKAFVWVTARQHDTDILQESLSIFDIRFNPLKPEQQEEYFKNAWENTLRLKIRPERMQNVFASTPDSKFNKYYSELKKHMDKVFQDEKSDFMGIPITLRLFAESFRKKIEIFATKNDQDMNIQDDFRNFSFLSLYQNFIDAKFEIFFKEKTNLSTESNHIAATYKLSIIKKHQRLAFNELYGNFSTEDILGLKSPFLPDFKKNHTELEELARCGLIKYVQSDNVEFIHRTIAEYFVATLFVYLMTSKKNRNSVIYNKTCKFLEKNSYSNNNIVVCKFLDALAEQDGNNVDSDWYCEWKNLRHKEYENLLGKVEYINKEIDFKCRNIDLIRDADLYELKQDLENKIFGNAECIYKLFSKFITVKDIAALKDILELFLKMAYKIILRGQDSVTDEKKAIESILPTTIKYYVTQANEQGENDFKFIKDSLNKIATDYQRIDTNFRQNLAYILNDEEKSEILAKWIKGLPPNVNDEKLIRRINKEYSKKDFKWLERDGIKIVKSSMILTFDMSNCFYNFIESITDYNGFHTVYSANIHNGLITPILNMLQLEILYPKQFTNINKSALLNMFQAFSKFDSHCKQKRHLTVLELESLLSCIEHVMHPDNISVYNVFYAIECLRELNSWGFTLGEDLTLMHRENKVYKYQLKMQHKLKIVRLLKFRNLNNESKFREECTKFVNGNYEN